MGSALGDFLGVLTRGAVMYAENAGRTKTVRAPDAARAAQRQGIYTSAEIPPPVPPPAGSKKDREIKRMRLAHAAEIREKDRAHAAEIAQLQAQLAAQQR